MHRVVLTPVLTLLMAVALAPAAAATTATAKLTYITGSSIYIDAGAEDGLREADRLQVVRAGEVIAVVEVTYLSRHRASCRIVESSTDLKVGDEVRFEPHQEPVEVKKPEPPSPPAVPVAGRGSGLAGAGISGRIGVRYQTVDDHLNDNGGFSQPALDLRLDGYNINGTGWGVTADVRARRTYFVPDNVEDDGLTRVYAAAVRWDGLDSPLRVTVGRQFSSALTPVSIFDGAAAEFVKPRWSVGLFSGTQPDAEDFGYSSEITEHGGWFQVRGGRVTNHRWELTTGLVGSYQDSEVNREFLFLQGRYTGPRLSLLLGQEIDYNRGWKVEEAGEDTIDPTSTFLSMYFRAGNHVDFRAGYDNRRNVRLYRDRVTPVTEFDDAYRQGVWVGTTVRFQQRFRIGLDLKDSSGGNSGSADAYTMTFGVDRLTPVNLNLWTRSTNYSSDILEGWLHAVTLGVPINARVHLALTGGRRDETSQVTPDLDETLDWYGVDLDWVLGGHWFLLLSAERSRGELEEIDQTYLAVTYRF